VLNKFRRFKKYNAGYKIQFPMAKKIPALNSQSPHNDELYIEGLYVAEGWAEGSHVALSGQQSLNVVNYLVEQNIPYRLTKNSNGTPMLYINASKLKEKLQLMGYNSKTKHFLMERLSLPTEKLKILLEGYIDGDGYKNPKRIDMYGNINRNVEVIYNTCSKLLAKQLLFINRILGKYTYIWLQENHQGLGKQPIYRLYTYRKTVHHQEIIPYITKVAIKNIEEIGKEPVYDITVADTHNFVLAHSGVIVHNCEDMSILFMDMLTKAGIISRMVVGRYINLEKGYRTGHAWVEAVGNNKLYIIETTTKPYGRIYVADIRKFKSYKDIYKSIPYPHIYKPFRYYYPWDKITPIRIPWWF